MAQAARLNLRMQKELKLLLTDPPPGASFPSLYAAPTTTTTSSSSAGPSLSSIDAQIEGPEGTVYAKGFFKLKIQIPDRYPFQPPIVTFATPIYHPNIDNGGRICLDILNLPPKGAWQPSLNISTVLTSIGLLLSEPNPDDGLMHEASHEYKYNRQAFDHKARSMTEKYARTGASESADVGQCCQTLLNSSMDSADAIVSDTSIMDMTEYLVSNKRFCGISRKLSLESSELDQERNDGKILNEVQSKHLYERQMELKGLKQEPNRMHSEQNHTHEDLQRMKKKLSLEPVKKDNDKIDLVSKNWESTSRTDSSKSLPLVEAGFNAQQKPNQDGVERSKSNSKDTELEKDELLNSLDSKQGMGNHQEELLSVAQQSATQCQSSGSQKNFPMPHPIRKSGREGHCEIVDLDGDGFMKIKHKKLGLAGREFSSGMLVPYQCQQNDDSENLAPNSSFALAYSSKNPTPSSSLLVVSKAGHCNDRSTLNYSTTCLSQNSYKTEHRQPLKLLTQSSDSNNGNIQSPSKISTVQHDSCWDENLHAKQDCMETFAVGIKKQEEMSASFDADTVIVLDSEDSDEDQGRAGRSKLSLARRRLPGKLKS